MRCECSVIGGSTLHTTHGKHACHPQVPAAIEARRAYFTVGGVANFEEKMEEVQSQMNIGRDKFVPICYQYDSGMGYVGTNVTFVPDMDAYTGLHLSSHA